MYKCGEFLHKNSTPIWDNSKALIYLGRDNDRRKNICLGTIADICNWT